MRTFPPLTSLVVSSYNGPYQMVFRVVFTGSKMVQIIEDKVLSATASCAGLRIYCMECKACS